MRSGSRTRPLVGADAPMLVGADAPAGTGEDSLVVMRVDPPKSAGNGSSAQHRGDPPKSAGNGSSAQHGGDHLPAGHWTRRRERPIPARGGDQGSAFSREVEERQSFRPSYAGEVEDPSEMERQVRDQLYGPGFRRR